MGLVNKTTINFIVKQGEKLGKSLLVKPAETANIKGLKYMPRQLTKDVVEVSQKARAPIEPATLQELANKGLSLNEMASELGIPMSTVRLHLQKNNIVTAAQKEFRVLKEYFTASTKEGKAKAFAEVDKYLEQIAKKETLLRKGSSYEDCLQDVRLRFFELADQSQKEGITFAKNILQRVRETRPALKKEMQTVPIKRSAIAKADKPVNDYQTENFEFRDSYEQLLKSNSGVSERNKNLFKGYVEENKPISELASSCGIGEERVRQILKNEVVPKLKLQHNKATSNEYLHRKSQAAAKYVNRHTC